MRARQIKPGFYKNEILASTSPHARLLFAGLWMLADRAGRLEDRPLRIRGELFPYEVIDVDALLWELSNAKPPNGQPELIFRYQFEDANYIQIVNFERHQNPHVKEAPSTIPAPESPGASTVQAGERHIRATLTPSSLTPDSPLLILKKGRFAPPTLEEVTFHVQEKKYHFSGEAFWNYYESVGWKVGTKPMKKWQKACATWETRWKVDHPELQPSRRGPLCTKCLVRPPSVDPPSQFCPSCLEGILADADREGVRVE